MLEAASGFEPEIKVLQTSALPLGYAATGRMNAYYKINHIKIKSISFIILKGNNY